MVEKDQIYERRHPVICARCKTVMTFANMVRFSRHGEKSIYVKYVCPNREGEKGCGISEWVPFDKIAP